jgi:putative tricarboxylic transport membrane protein
MDVRIMLIFGVIGYLMRKFAYEGAPLILAFILGPLMERAFVQSLNMSGGTYKIFFASTISATTTVISVIILLSMGIPLFHKRASRDRARRDDS